MILDMVLRMEASVDELKGMVVCNEWRNAISHSLITYFRLWAPVQV
jgi:hypothetical protein